MEERSPSPGAAGVTIQLEMDGALRQIRLERGEDSSQYHVSIDGESDIAVEAYLLRPGLLSLHIAGQVYRCVLEESAEGAAIHIAGARMPYSVDDPRSLKSRRSRHGGSEGPKPLTAPMPGRVVRVLVHAGDQVEAQQGICVIEAMKMQNELKSPKAGRLVELRAEAGSTVSAGEVLAIVE